MIDRLDQDATADDHRILREIAIAAADKFDLPMQEALFDLAAAGGWTRTAAALDTLSLVSPDRQKVCSFALQALARGDAVPTATPIVASSLLPEHREFVSRALPALVNAAAPSHAPIGLSDQPGDPAGLLAVHRLFPDLVYDALRAILASPSKDDRIDACEALLHLIPADPSFPLKLAPELISSLSLPDDMYNRGSSAIAVARVLALTMRVMPRETDAIISREMSTASEATGAALLRTYSEVLRPEFDGPPRVATDADPLAIRRIIQTFLDRRADERLTEATDTLRDGAEYFPDLVAAEAETLLGAAALIAEDLKERYSPLLDPRPTVEKALEAQTRQLRLDSALNAITAALGVAMAHGLTAVQQVLQALAGLGPSHPRLRAALVTGFRMLRNNPPAIAAVLPTLYSSMTDPHQEVRAAAAVAYGHLTEDLAPDDLPALLHETFLTLLRDPYVIVHTSAVRALHPAALPPELRTTALRLIAAVLVASLRQDSDGRFLADCIELLLGLAAMTENLAPGLLEQVVASLARLRTETAVEVLRCAWRIRTAGNFGDLLLRLLEEDTLDDHDVERLVDELHHLTESSLRSRAARLRDIAVRRCVHSAHHIVDFVEVLSRSGAWGEAADVARALFQTASDTRSDRPRKLRLRALLIATQIEAAAARGNHEGAIAAAAEWLGVAEEIRQDDEENAEARRPFPGLRLPNQDD